MQVLVESIGQLEKRLTVQVPSDEVEKEVVARLKSLSARVKVDGFRKGKVPLDIIKKQYDPQVRQEVLQSIVQRTFEEAVIQQKLRPAGGPRIEPKNINPGQSFEYSATFEVYPEIALQSLQGVVLQKINAQVHESDVDAMLQKLRLQRTIWEVVTRAARQDDQLTINFVGSIDGVPFAGGKADNHKLVLGSKTMIEGFEDKLVGVKPASHTIIEVRFPSSYWQKDLADKNAKFEIEVISVAERKLPELNDEFAKNFGTHEGGLAQLRLEVGENMQRELLQKLNSRQKEDIFAALLQKHTISVPNALVEQEIRKLINEYKQSMPKLRDDQLPHDVIRTTAERRVKLGLLLAECIRKNDLLGENKKIEPRVEQTLREIAATYDDPDKLIAHYRGNPKMMEQVRSLALEDEVANILLTELTVEEKLSSFDEVMNPPQS